MSINSGKPAGSKSASKAATLSGSSQPKYLLFLDQLEVDVTGTIVIMVGRVWDVNAVTRRYLSTDFVVSDSKGNMIRCSAKSSVAHNFLRLKEGVIYSVKNFVVLPNKDEFRIFRHDMFMIEFDGETTTRKVSADPYGFRGYPFRLIEFVQVKPANNKYLIGKPAGSKSASKAATLSGSSQPKYLLFLDQLEVDVTGTIVIMVGRVWDVNAVTRRYLSTDFVVSDSKGNMIRCSAKSSVAHNFLRLKEGVIYSVKNFVVLPNKDEFRIFRHDMFMIEFDGETTTRKTATFHCKVMIENFRTKKGGTTRPVVMKSAGKVLHENLGNRYRLEAVVVDDTAHTIVVMFNNTVTELLKCSVESLMGMEDGYSHADDELNLPINPNASTEDDVSSSTPAVTANNDEPSMKIVMKPPTICTPLKPNEEKKQKGHDLQDLDVAEVSEPLKNKGKFNIHVVVDTKKKRKRYTTRGYGPAQEFKFDWFTYTNNPKDNAGMKTRL
nr:hypothetical protein [Tanacetum cinerariifolium]